MVIETNIIKSEYGAKAQQLLRVAQKLRDVGAQALLDVPRIAVIGGQSAGKSSAVEAFSGIRVPRAAGTCTRCPMEVNLKNRAGPWTCEVSLRLEYDSRGAPLKEIKHVPFGKSLTSSDEVELALMRAQAAVLNYPAILYEEFVNKTRAEIEEFRTARAFANGTLKFSKNVVCVDVYDEESPDLSFVDLPGLVQNDTPQLIQLVEDVVKSNIKGRCLILVAIPMSDDMENQRSMRIALEVDPTRSRTIGVLTKPDTLTKGATSARQKWMDVLTGHDLVNALKLGYYCVKLADDAERSLNLSRLERDKKEIEFFQNSELWNQPQCQKRLGVRNLMADLSRQLTNLLDLALPELRTQAQSQLTDCKNAIVRLPEPLKVDPTIEIINRTTDFCQQITLIVGGRESDSDNDNIKLDGKTFVQKNRDAYKTFKSMIRKTAPDFRAFVDHKQFLKPSFSIEDEGSNKAEENDDNSDCGPFNLCYVRQVITDTIAWELPNSIHFDAKKRLISNFTDLWDIPSEACCEQVIKNLESHLSRIIDENFERYPKLRHHMRELIMEMLEEQKSKAVAAVSSALDLEKNPFFTQNTHSLEKYREKCLAHYKEVRRNRKYFAKNNPSNVKGLNGHERGLEDNNVERAQADVQTLTDIDGVSLTERALQALKIVGYPNLKEEDLPRLLPTDEYHQEMILMADVRAYFQVAYKRVIDNIPLTIEHSLNQGLANSIKTELLQRLGVGATDTSKHLSELLEEDAEIKCERDGLETRKGRLVQILKELHRL